MFESKSQFFIVKFLMESDDEKNSISLIFEFTESKADHEI